MFTAKPRKVFLMVVKSQRNNKQDEAGKGIFINENEREENTMSGRKSQELEGITLLGNQKTKYGNNMKSIYAGREDDTW